MCDAFLSYVDRTCDLLLTNRIQHKDSRMSLLCFILHRTVSPILQGDFLSCWLWRSKLPWYELLYGEGHMERNWGWPLDDSLKETEAFNQTTCKELNAVDNHWKWILPQSGLRWDRSPDWHLNCSPWALNQRSQRRCAWTLDLQNLWHNKCVLF